MDCPKCDAEMNVKNLRTLDGLIEFDQCSSCKGFWFDTGEAEKLKDAWETDFIDSGDPETGKKFNEVRDVNCPRCGKKMEQVADPKQRHILLETCPEHGVFMDAGEFRDYKNETVGDIFKGLRALIKRG
jgi:Zn-finger nucleic acid-binding protein